NFRVLEQRDLENARSPFRVVQDDGGEVGWVNRFLDRQRVRCVADSSLRGYAHDLLHFLRWWAGVSHSPEISEEAGPEATLLDYIRFQTNPQPRPAAASINRRTCNSLHRTCIVSTPAPWRNRSGAFLLHHETTPSARSSFEAFLRALRRVPHYGARRCLRERLSRHLRRFLHYLGAQHPEVRRLEQLRRDPHVLGWLAEIRAHVPPLAKSTIATQVLYLHPLLEDVAFTRQIPTLTHLLSREDAPRPERKLPRPLLPEQDQRIQQELRRRNDLASNLLLLQRHTGMRIGECVDLAADCLRPLGPDKWAIHVPLGKLKTERLVRAGKLPAASASQPGNFDSPCSRRVPRRSRCRGNYGPPRSSPESSYVCDGNVARRRHLPRNHGITRTRQPRHDPALPGNHAARFAARVSSGAIPTPTPGPIPSSPSLRFLARRFAGHAGFTGHRPARP